MAIKCGHCTNRHDTVGEVAFCAAVDAMHAAEADFDLEVAMERNQNSDREYVENHYPLFYHEMETARYEEAMWTERIND